MPPARTLEPRLRIFAGPNGSGKSTIIRSVREHRNANGNPIKFGRYVNADEIVVRLEQKRCIRLATYGASQSRVVFHAFVRCSGLTGARFPWADFEQSHTMRKGVLSIPDDLPRGVIEALAQILAAYFVDELLTNMKAFSFETVFSHESKVALMKRAQEAGYKVYLYFVATESPKVNVERVLRRWKDGGHNVPPEKIVERYYRSLDLLYEAIGTCYHAFMFDNTNSDEREGSWMFAEYKANAKKRWQPLDPDGRLPVWFNKYYVDKYFKETA